MGLALWVAFWVVFGLGDYWLSKHGLSLSQAIRDVFHTDTTSGKLTFTAVLTVAAVILHLHITKG